MDAVKWPVMQVFNSIMGGPGTNGDSEIGFAELKKLPAFEIVAVCACAPGIAAD
jgi:hypothetical protein